MAAPKEGGFKLSLGSLKGKQGLKAKGPTQNLAKRPRLALGDDEQDDSNKQQEISGFDVEGGVMDVNGKTKEKEGPLVIPALPNRNWGERMRKEKEELARKQDAEKDAQMEEKKIEFGLTFAKKEATEDTEVKDSAPVEASEVKDNLTEEQRLEKNALEALLHGKPVDEHVIPIQTEEEAFQNDMKEAPDAPTLEAYEATPIEGFGAALLRGMGWKDGQSIGRNGAPAKQVEIKKRPALLGIGAKEEAAVGVELGEWGKGKKSKAVQSYNPVALQNRKTGEILTEEELKAKIEAQSMVRDDKPTSSGRSKYENESEVRSRDKRDRRRDDDYDSERKRDRDRDRRDEKNYDSARRRDKRRDRDDDYHDSERRKEKRRDKDRRDRSRSPDDKKEGRKGRDRRDRSRSRDSDYKREKRRERDRDRDRRDRSRSRDSEDRRKRRRDREYDYEDDRDDRKRRHREEKYSSSRR